MATRACASLTSLTSLVLLGACCVGCERGELLGALQPRPFGPPRLVSELSDPEARDTDPTFTADRCELYFMSDRSGSKDLYRSLRADPTEPWSAPERVDELSTGYQEENPHVSSDGLTLWFYTDRDRSLGTIWQSTRDSRTSPWGEPTPVPSLGNGQGSSDVAVGVGADEKLAVLASSPPQARSYDLYLYERPSRADPFGEPRLLADVSSSADDFDPVLVDGGRLIAFHSNVLGSHDLFTARRGSRNEPFEAPIPVEELNTDAAESAPEFSEDATYVMFSSNRAGTEDLYEATREP